MPSGVYKDIDHNPKSKNLFIGYRKGTDTVVRADGYGWHTFYFNVHLFKIIDIFLHKVTEINNVPIDPHLGSSSFFFILFKFGIYCHKGSWKQFIARMGNLINLHIQNKIHCHSFKFVSLVA